MKRPRFYIRFNFPGHPNHGRLVKCRNPNAFYLEFTDSYDDARTTACRGEWSNMTFEATHE